MKWVFVIPYYPDANKSHELQAYGRHAEELSLALGIVLTKQRHRLEGQQTATDYPMAGFPAAQLETNIRQLVQVHGRKVALYEQFPASEHDNLITRRMVRIYTPGTLYEPSFTTTYENNFLLAITPLPSDSWALGYTDLSTGEAFETSVPTPLLSAELARIDPKEIVVAAYLLSNDSFLSTALASCSTTISALTSIGDIHSPMDALQIYLKQVMPEQSVVLKPSRSGEVCMRLSPAALSALEIKQTKTAGVLTARGSLLSTLRRTNTPGGSRLLAQRLCKRSVPLLSQKTQLI